MRTKIEGVLLNKIPHNERNLIGRVLLRNGRKVSILFYGGLPGGKKMKSTSLEVGHMLQIELQQVTKNSQMYTTREWKPLWVHDNVRHNHQAFSLLCLVLETADKLSLEDDLKENEEFKEEEFLFNIVSNALFHIEKSLSEKEFDCYKSLFIFLGRLIQYLGISPDLATCCVSGESLKLEDPKVLSVDRGGFIHGEHQNATSLEHMRAETETSSLIWLNLLKLGQESYQNFTSEGAIEAKHCLILKNYFFYHFQISDNDLKTLKFLL